MGNTAYNSLDYNKCILIVMVILCHVIHFGHLYPQTQDAILMIVNPAFLMITGYLVNIRKPWKEFSTYLLRIILPYVIMSLGFGILSLYLPTRFGITDARPATLLHMLLVAPIGPYWYFHTMIVCSSLYYASFHIGRLSRAGSFMLYAALLLICVRYTGIVAMRQAFAFLIGAGVRTFHGDFSKVYPPTYLAILPFLLLLSPHPTSWSDLNVILLSFCFICFCSRLAEISRGKCAHVMGYIGRNTFPVYIFHPIFTMLSKHTTELFVYDPTGLLHTVFTVVLCVSGSLSIAYVMDKIHLSYCFGRKSILR